MTKNVQRLMATEDLEDDADIEEELSEKEVANLQRLATFALKITRDRKEAIDFRKTSGVEEMWREDEEHYEGIDDLNRHEGIGTINSYKPQTLAGAFEVQNTINRKSSGFLNVTRPYVDTSAARVADMLLPTDDRSWSIKITPIPEIGDVLRGIENQVSEKEIQDAEAELKRVRQEATRRMGKATDRIEDWLVQSQWHSEGRKIIEDSARIGTGVLRGPMPNEIEYRVQKFERKIIPASRRVPALNCYPAKDCGEDIQAGSYFLERDELSGKEIIRLLDNKEYIRSELLEIIKEGPKKKVAEGNRNYTFSESDQFEIWWYYGQCSKEDFEAAGTSTNTLLNSIPCIAIMINDRIVKLTDAYLESGAYPYSFMPWQRRSGSPWGIGVSRQIRTPQRMINGANRAMMNNAGLASGPQLVIWQGKLIPADNDYTITPLKLWTVPEDADVTSVNNAIHAINIDMHQRELLEIVTFALKMAEESSGLPMLMQGQMGKSPETLGGMQMLFNSANTVLRRIAKLFDDNIVEPHIGMYYEWLMLYGEEDEKGDYTVDARGSSALVERDIQNQAIAQLGAIVKDPDYDMDPKLWLEEYLKSQHLDVGRFKLTEERKEELAQRAKPVDPAMAVAQMKAQLELQLQEQKLLVEAEFLKTKTILGREQREYDMAKLQLQLQIEAMKFAQEQKMDLEKVKAQLMQFTIGEKTKRELFAAEAALKVNEGSGI